jgi:hypothetical protein
MQELLDELKEITSANGNAIVSVQGECELVKPMEIVYNDQTGNLHKITLPCEEEQLVQACEPASFGKGQVDVLDPSYRTAYKLDNNKFFTNFDLSEHEILLQIKNALGPAQKQCEVKASLYKLNIYSKGGFFKEHVDTPRSDKMFGSLVVCLDQPFQGGALMLERNGIWTTFDWSQKYQHQRTTGTSGQVSQIQWCSFYSDCPHKIEAVTEGYRLTFTYNLEWIEEDDKVIAEARYTVPNLKFFYSIEDISIVCPIS